MDFRLSEHFYMSEYQCKDGSMFIELELVEKVEQLRKILGRPIIINSGYRSPEYNVKIGGASNSQHIYGRAVDIQKFDGLSDEFIETLAVMLGFRGIGIYNNFYHLDIREELINKVDRSYDRWEG